MRHGLVEACQSIADSRPGFRIPQELLAIQDRAQPTDCPFIRQGRLLELAFGLGQQGIAAQ
jgi:hypothetical protein